MFKSSELKDGCVLYARYLCSRDALGIKAGRPSTARDDRVYCIQGCVQRGRANAYILVYKIPYRRVQPLGRERRANIGISFELSADGLTRVTQTFDCTLVKISHFNYLKKLIYVLNIIDDA